MRLPAFVFAVALVPLAVHADAPTGDWVTQDGQATVHIAPCGADLCGTIAALKDPIDPATGKPPVDSKNPDPALRDKPIVGVELLKDFKPAGDNRWKGGKIYDPKRGKSYAAKLQFRSDGNLDVKGCLGPFCESRTWTPAK